MDRSFLVRAGWTLVAIVLAYLVVAPSRAVAVTGADGRFELKGVPAGQHQLAIWERFARPRVREVTVEVPAGGARCLSAPGERSSGLRAFADRAGDARGDILAAGPGERVDAPHTRPRGGAAQATGRATYS